MCMFLGSGARSRAVAVDLLYLVPGWDKADD